MEKKNNKKGFTLAELLIVVAIIAVLVAIAIPVFSAQLEKSRESTDLANVRSAYASLTAEWLNEPQSKTISVAAKQKESGWAIGASQAKLVTMINGVQSSVPVPVVKDGNTYKVKVAKATGAVTVTE
jgi:type IV pilus assembly protein PilA